MKPNLLSNYLEVEEVYLQSSLAACGVIVNDETIALISLLMESIKEKGGQLSLDDILGAKNTCKNKMPSSNFEIQ